MKVFSSLLLALTTSAFFLVLVLLFSSSSSSSCLVSAGRLSDNHKLSMDDLLEERKHKRNMRRQRTPVEPRKVGASASRSFSNVEGDTTNSDSRSLSEVTPPPNPDDEIRMPQVLGRGNKHGWRHELKRRQEHKATAKAESLARVNPLMAHMSTEQRAAHLLYEKMEDKFVAQTAQARSLLQMLQNANPHHVIARKYAEKETPCPHEEAKKLKEKEHYEKVTALESIITRLEYQLSDIKNFAEEVAKDSAASREGHKDLQTGFETQLDKEKERCAELMVKQEEKLLEAHADLNERNKELQQVRSTLDSLSGVEGSSATGWKLTLIQHAEIIVAAVGVSFLVMIALVYVLGRNRGRRQGLTMKRGGDDYLFDGRSAGAAASASSTSEYKKADLGSNNSNNNSSINNAPPQQQPQQLGNGTTELRNRALHRFDGGV